MWSWLLIWFLLWFSVVLVVMVVSINSIFKHINILKLN
jgi:hypothetical protein